MKMNLNDSWVLTNEHSASSYGKPVLVELETGQAYGPRDILQVNPGGGFVPGYIAVKGMTEGSVFTEEEQAFLDRF